jgi:hypothetical protein
VPQVGFEVRGIGYDAGVLYEFDFNSHPDWSPEAVRRDLRSIRRELGCTHVLVMATQIDRLLATCRMAREEGLEAWVQPRLFEGTRDEVAANLAAAAEGAEELRLEFGGVSLNVGCELSLSTRGFLPGRSFVARGTLLAFTFWMLPLANLRLRRFLRRLAGVARSRFGGPISYGAGDWERPDWSVFDVVGLDAYREASNQWRFADDIRSTVQRHHAAGRPVVVFEFGACTYRGASARASQGASVLREREGRLAVPSSLVRDEDEQARYLDELLDVFNGADVDGAFVYGFSEPGLPESDEPGRDLDLASYGIVALQPDGRRRRKAAFELLAQRYGGTR